MATGQPEFPLGAPSSSSRSTRCAPTTLPSTATATATTPAIDAFARDAVVFERRLLAFAADAAGARLDPLRPPAVRARRARQRWLHREAGRGAAAGAPQAQRLGFRRLRVGVRAAQGNRHRPGLRRLRQQPARGLGRVFLRADPAQGRGHSRRRARWLSGWRGRDPRFFLFFHVYEPHKPYEPPARFAALAPYDGEIAAADEAFGGLVQKPPRPRPLRPRADRAARRPRRGPGRPRRAGARPVSLQRDDPRAAPRQAAAGAGWRTASHCHGAAHRPGADAPRHGWRCAAFRVGLAGSLAAAAPRRDAGGASRARGLFRGVLLPLPLRLERAVRAHRLALPLHPRAEATSCTTSSPTSPSATTSSAAQPQTRTAMRAALAARDSPARKAEGPGQVSAEDRERLAALGYVGGTRSLDGCRCRYARRPEGQGAHPGGVSRGVGAGGPAPLRRGAAALPEDPGRRSGDVGRMAATGAGQPAGRRRCGRCRLPSSARWR